jgi:hypothetical protein
MNRWSIALLILACMGTAPAVMAGASEDAAKTADIAADTAESEARGQRCVNLHRIKTTRVLDDQTIVFEMTGQQTLVNNLPHRCPGLGFEKSFGYKTSINQLCSHDTIWVVTTIGRGASCGLGEFMPYVAPENTGAEHDKGKLEPVTE